MKGTVTDAAGASVEGAVVRVSQRSKDVTTSSGGEFWRLLVPGVYTFQAFKDDMESEEAEVVVEEGAREGPVLDLVLTRKSAVKTSQTSTSPTTTTAENTIKEEGLKLRDPLGLICVEVTWTGLKGCD